MKSLVGFLGGVLAAACASVAGHNKPSQLEPERIQEIADAVFEVVIPKKDEPNITYAGGRALPVQELPYQERNDRYFSVGTAFAIGGDRLVSAAHVFQLDVFDTDRRFFVRNHDGKVYPVGQVERFSQYRDLIVFTITGAPSPLPALAPEEDTQVGQRVYTAGNANGEGIAIRDGQIASYTFEPVTGAWKDLRFSAAASPGNSGGPLLNTRGEAVGVVVRRNENENLNVAVPIAELKRLANDEAEFFVASAEANADGEPARDFRYKTSLPATLETLAGKAEAARRQFHMEQWRQAMKTSGANIFPKDPALADFVGVQTYAPLIQTLTYEAKDGYRLTPDDPAFERRTARGEVVSGMTDEPEYDLAFIALPARARPADYIKRPELLMDALIDAYGFAREFNGRKLPLRSFGPPDHAGVFTDMIGRPWIKASWHTWYNEGSLLLNCLPAPTGFGCSLDNVASSEETFGLQEKFEEYYAALHSMSYQGTVADWRRFLALDNRYLPASLQGLEIGKGKRRVSVTAGDFHLDYPQPLFADDTWIFAGVGYGMQSLLVPEIQSLRLDHGADRSVSEQFDVYLSPAKGDSSGDRGKGTSSDGNEDAGAVYRVLGLRSLKNGRKLVQTVECRGPGRKPTQAVVATCNTIERTLGSKGGSR